MKLIDDSELIEIADEIRHKTSFTDELSLEQMKADIASIPSELGEVESYVETEAQRVADIVAGLQNENTISFIAMTDVHRSTKDAQNTATVLHAIQGARLVSEKVPIEFSVVLGDLVSGAEKDTLEQHMTNHLSLLRESSKLSPIKLCGNHDTNVYNLASYILSDRLYRYVGRYNRDVVKPTEEYERNYFHFDLEDKKLRVICLNTSDMNDIATNKLGDGCWVGEHQFEWLIDTLDMTGKSDWKIIVLSHHPIHWGNKAIVALLSMLDAYVSGSSGNAVFEDINVNIPYDFAGKNDARLIACFHGHTHNLIYGVAGENNIVRIGTPNACFGRNNEYGHTKYGYKETFVQKYGEVTVDENGVSTPIVYAKTANTAKDTAFCVYTIDFATETIYATCYGAGHDREISFEKVEKTYYAVTNNFTNVTSDNNVVTIEEGTSYIANLSGNTGYELESVTVTMGGVDVTEAAYSNGVITIPQVTGDITITATATFIPVVLDMEEIGYQDGYRISSSAKGVKAATGYTTTDMIDLLGYGKTSYPIIVTVGGGLDINYSVYANSYTGMYNSNREWITAVGTLPGATNATYTYAELNDDGTVSVTFKEVCATKDIRYARISGYGKGADAVITISQGYNYKAAE